jgi:uncharacterized protein
LGCFPVVIVDGLDWECNAQPGHVNVRADLTIVIPRRNANPGRRPGNKLNFATIAILVSGALAGGFVSGLTGFGTALMALGIWLYVVPASVAVPLVLICSVAAQLSTLPTMWKLLDFRLALPFVAGGLLGMPIGTALVARADPHVFKLSVGVMLLVFPAALYFMRSDLSVRLGGRAADAAVGFAGGILGGLAGLSGPLPILWASVRGWSKDQRRGVFQIFNGAVLGAALCLQIASGFVAGDVFWLALLVLPGTFLGAWLGTLTYRALSDRNFYDLVLGLLFLSGVSMVWSGIAPS